MATITLSPTSGKPGDRIAIVGSDFGWKWWATITLDGAQVAKVQGSTTGSFSTTFVIPVGTSGGPRTVKAKTRYRQATATLTVTPILWPPPPTPEPSYLIISAADLAALPMTGAAWTAMLASANATWPVPDLDNMNATHQLYVLAASFVYARNGSATLRTKARDGIAAALPTFAGGASNGALSLGRQLAPYVIAADLIRLSELDPTLDAALRSKLSTWRDATVGTHGIWNKLSVTFAISSNNWGTHAGTAVIAIDRYLGRPLDGDWAIFQGFAGDRAAHTFPTPWTFAQGDPAYLSWTCGTTWRPMAQCPDDRDGAVIEDAQRSGPYPAVNLWYIGDSAQSLALQAELLHQAGYPAWPLLARSAAFLSRYPDLWTSLGGRGVRTLAFLYNRRLGLGVSTAYVGDRRMWSFAHCDWLYAS